MELVAEYRQIDEPRRVEPLPYETEWASFHESRERTISVFAGRGTGKTYNLALRAARSEHDCIIFVQHSHSIRMILDLVVELSLEVVDVSTSRQMARIQYPNGRRVSVEALSHFTSIRGRRLNGELMFDEFDHVQFEFFMTNDHVIPFLQSVRHIVCVGSLKGFEDSPGKRWFKGSDTRIFVDAKSQPPTRGHMRYEYFPSEKRLALENLPPFSYEI